jgi:very-short-patch-repair endonuclease
VNADVALRALGGSARWTQLDGHVSRRQLADAVRDGHVLRSGRAYCLPSTTRPQQLAAAHRATRSHATAAEHWGWPMPPDDGVIRLTVPFKAQRTTKPPEVRLRYRDLDDTEVVGDVTSPLRTAVDCLRDECLRVALSVGDSALRSGLIEYDELAAAVAALRGPGSRRARDRLRMLDARAANAFESCARAILLEAGFTDFEPQVSISHRGVWIGRVDLAYLALRIVIECDGFETHGTLAGMTKDATRHTWLVSAGWRPLRFTWRQVMSDHEWVLDRVRDTVSVALGAGIAVQTRQEAAARVA